MSQASQSLHEPHPLDALTDGAFSAPTSGERAARIRDWLTTNPDPARLQEVFKELSVKDKGAAKLLREKLDDIRRAKGQEVIAQEWAQKASSLLSNTRFHIADALAWQRDAAKAGAPLSKEPLSLLKVQLSDRVKTIEDLQHRVQVQREAAVLLAQRIEVLSTKSWRDAQLAMDTLRDDVGHWQVQAAALLADASWSSVEAKFPPLLESSRAQLLVVWDAFSNALSQAVAASGDVNAPLPAVAVWADEFRALRGVAKEPVSKPKKPVVDPQLRQQAMSAVQAVLAKLEEEVAQGHGKASAGAANALRSALKEHGRMIDDKLEAQAHTALAAAGELEGWQRWRADQLRDELVAKAQGLLNRPDGQAIGGRKMQENLRSLREQWKQTDQGGAANQHAWKQFDEACNEAYKVVEAWLEKIKSEAVANRVQRLALIEELNAWAADNRTARDGDWKGFHRVLHEFGDRWRDAGHLGEKAFAELQPLWKAAINTAAEPLESMQKQSLAARQALIDEAAVLGAAATLRIDAVKQLQQRWQAEVHRVPVDRRLEQKLWDAFRKPIDDAFGRMSAQRESAAAALSERDKLVLEASKELETANASGNAQHIRTAMAGLEAALRGQALARASVSAGVTVAQQKAVHDGMQPRVDGLTSLDEVGDGTHAGGSAGASEGVAASDNHSAVSKRNSGSEPMGVRHDAIENIANGESDSASVVAPQPAPIAAKPSKPVIAVRGDDRPGMKKAEPAAVGRGGKLGDRKEGGRGPRDSQGGNFADGRADSRPRSDARGDARPDSRSGTAFSGRERSVEYAPAAPRLGDVAFRAQREALEHAELALRKLASQAHGETLTNLLTAWEMRDASKLPGAQELGSRVSSGVRSAWSIAVGQTAKGDASTALLRLEMAAEVPTAAQFLDDRRALQLQLLTRRHDAPPAQTWGVDVGTVLASAHEPAVARRLQGVLRVLLKN